MLKTQFTACFEALLAFLNRIPADKVAHALYGSLLSSLLVSALLVFSTPCPGVVTFLAITAIGLLKEGYDRLNGTKHTPDVWDAVATSLGSLIPLLPAYL